MREIPRVAVVPTHSRPAELLRLLGSLASQCDVVFVIDNASTPPVVSYDENVRIIRDEEQPPNLSRLWNVGLERAANMWLDVSMYDVGVFNDDANVPAGWWDTVSDALRAHPTAAVACTPAYAPIHEPILKTRPDGDLYARMTPWAFVTRGELGMRSDERMRWWWFDTDWDFRARQSGGVLTVPGPIVTNTGANSSTVGPLAEQAGRDRRTFAEIWGSNPW